MKKISLKSLCLILTFALVACEETTDDVSDITYYPVFEMHGDQVILHPLGQPFNDPGVTATEGGNELEVEKSVLGVYRVGITNAVDVNTADHYIITYTAENADGFEGSTHRDVWVAQTGDLVNSIAGLYRSTVVRDGAVDPQYANLEYVLIWENQDGTYGISDVIGGYYALGRDYGVDYAAQGGVITANDIPSDDFSFGNPVPVGPFGGNAEITSMSVDPATNTITFTAVWDLGYTFEVTLEQVQI